MVEDMKVYYIYPDNYDYDDFEGFIVVAENESRALEMVRDKFKTHQGEIHVEEDLATEHIALEAFNAG